MARLNGIGHLNIVVPVAREKVIFILYTVLFTAAASFCRQMHQEIDNYEGVGKKLAVACLHKLSLARYSHNSKALTCPSPAKVWF